MNLQQLLDKNIKPLYDFVNAQYPVKLKKSNDKFWGAYVEFRKQKHSAIIHWADTKYPRPCLVHELLHIKNQILGYKRIKIGIALDDDILKGGYLGIVCNAIDNEFQHHKMFTEYTSLGFKPENFYNDDDANTEKYLTDYLRNDETNFINLSIQYLTLIAPGGHMAENKIQELKAEFRKQNGGKFAENFDEIDNLINDYKQDELYDAEIYIKRFINNLVCGRVWIGYSDKLEFTPNNGYFVNEHFDIKDIKLAYGN